MKATVEQEQKFTALKLTLVIESQEELDTLKAVCNRESVDLIASVKKASDCQKADVATWEIISSNLHSLLSPL